MPDLHLSRDETDDLIAYILSLRKREPMAAYWFGGLEGRLLRLGESGLMSMIG
jgi:hypothetical protein